ncbi:hypothetical protein B1219_20205 [Pseudomonas ogarae]|uniref:hypothetical protein n=1 Tax=Pseudomonas ogarae (strain DSM 112162 / CECT 30235 / F113) TaxID=1114970 RepID=UPI0009A2D649|nr:hypothetical protein [Pseudomonas ogarae]OPG70630.1 hypothetical protein B1219_20205 [Pseudomonas ogarae]OPG79299.1 hypothetical protein B1218_11060 [Pseudomonas ogarae]
MSVIPDRTFAEVLKHTVKRILSYWTQITVTLGLLATGLGFITLYLYTRTIGRIDLFMPSIDVKSALLVWVVLVLLLMLSYLFILGATTWMFGCSVSLFSNMKDHQPKIVFYLVFPTVVGFSAFICTTFFLPTLLNPWETLAALFLIVFVACFLMYAFTPFKRIIRKSTLVQARLERARLKRLAAHQQIKRKKLQQHKAAPHQKTWSQEWLAYWQTFKNKTTPAWLWVKENWQRLLSWILARKEFWLVTLLSISIFITVIFAAFPILLTIRSYMERETPDTIPYVAGLSWLTLIFTLLPVVIFYCFKGDIYRRTFNGLIAMILAFCAFTLLSPGSLSQITYIAAGGLSVRQQTAERYTLPEDIKLQDLSATLWKTRQVAAQKIEVEAFQLYSFGDVLLLCPKDMLSLELKELKNYSKFCVSTLNSKVVRKPRLPVFARKPQDEWACRVPSWRIHAGRWLAWDALVPGVHRSAAGEKKG